MKPVMINVPSRYEVYLQTEEFDRIRQKVFARDGNKCVICGSTDGIEPHHLTYRNTYHENLDDLITLCRSCHSIHHAIAQREKAIEAIYSANDLAEKENKEKYWEEKREENIRAYKEEQERKQKIKYEIEKSIKDEYRMKDYGKNGDMDMCDWVVLNAVIDSKLAQYKDLNVYIDKSALRNWFACRRYEFLLRCLDKGFSYTELSKRTKFDPQWLWKWYRRDKLEAKLNEEKAINSMKED